ncbi:hypothetical protein CWI39_0505p0010 [Hamiltosporidium magnivora]|uniref:Uncharacterized protein n=1 Tax=Hamiltosporidium magnivora TaxID=148818 RepID=A0A4Q9LEJ4_9MICR|nr:hypothetical protein CWI39_0505p0010 [Hamiltosporidium magnivora]
MNAKKTISIHFYGDEAVNENQSHCESSLTSNYVGENNMILPNSNIRVLNTFLIDVDNFLLKFLPEEKFGESQHQNIYIKQSRLIYSDFVYFYRIIMMFPGLIQDLNESKYRLIFKILNIFDFEKNKQFKDFLRVISVSIMFNPNILNGRSIKSKQTNKHGLSDIISKIMVIEFFKICIFPKATIDSLKNIPRGASLAQYTQPGFIKLSEEILYLDQDFICKILKQKKIAREFFDILDYIFCIHTFKSLFLYNIDYTRKLSFFFDLSLFENIDELFLYKCFQVDCLLQTNYQKMHFKNVEILNIIHCEFTSANEIKFLQTLNLQSVKFILKNEQTEFRYCHSDLCLNLQNIVFNLTKEIFDYENQKYIFEKETLISCYESNKEFILKCYQDRSKIEMIGIPNILFQTYFTVELSNPYINFDFHILNIKVAKNIALLFKNTYIIDFNLQKPELYLEFVSLYIVSSIVTNIFLSKIVLLSSLKELSFLGCKLIFINNLKLSIENKTIKKISFKASVVENKNEFIVLLNSMSALKKIKLLCSDNDSNLFLSQSSDTVINLKNISSLYYSSFYRHGKQLPLFSMSSSLEFFDFSGSYPEGILFLIFGQDKFNNLKKLNLNEIKIGKKR